MATTATDTDGTSKAIQKVDNSLLGLLESKDVQAQIAKVATKHLTPDKLLRLVQGQVKQIDALAKCSIASVLNCVMQASRLGLEPGGALGLIYFVPFKGIATPIIGYKGLLTLIRRTGELRSIEAHPVHANDVFECEFGTSPSLRHIPKFNGTRGDITAFYSVAKLAGGETQVEVMTIEEVNAIRDRSKAAKEGPWVTDYSQMGRKTVLRRHSNYLPMASEKSDDAERLRHALSLDADDFETALLPHQPDRRKTLPQTLRGALKLEPAPAAPTIEATSSEAPADEAEEG